MNDQIQALENEKAEVQSKLEVIDQGGGNPEERPALADRLNYINNRISELKYQEQQTTEHTERIETAEAEISHSFDSIEYDGETYTIDAFAQNEVAAQALKLFITSKYKAQAETFSKQITEIKVERDAARKSEQEQRELAQSLKEQLAQVILEKNDLADKRDAAVLRAEEADNRAIEAERRADAAELLTNEKQEHIDKLRDEMAIGASNAIRVVDSNQSNNMADVMKQWRASRPAIYDVQATDPLRKVEFTAKYVENDEELTDKYVYIGKYRVLEGEELARFQTELEAKKQAEPVAPAVESDLAVVEEAVAVPPTFQEELAETPTGGVAEHEPVQSNDGEGFVTRAEFEAFKQEVDRKIAGVMGEEAA